MTLEAPEIASSAIPGQFMQVRCSDGADPLLRRPLGVHRVKDKRIEILYEVVGKGTGILSRRKSGESLDVLGPLGSGFSLPQVADDGRRTAILIAGGIGVAPLVFLAEELARKKIKIMVLIGAKTKEMILCEKDFRETGAEVHIATDDGSLGCKGFVSELLKRQLSIIKGRLSAAYACGPNPMFKCIAGMCEKHKIKCEVLLEERMACGIGACLGCAVKVKKPGSKQGFIYKLACKDGPVFNASEIVWE